MQRLFSMFPNGWPGTGLLLLRMSSGTILIRQALVGPPTMGLHFLEVLAGGLLVAGLWTPVAGLLVVGCQLWTVFALPDDVRSAVLLATIGAALVMLGPGSTSLDNRFFGRKRVAP